jgi:hypothetical protein
MTRVVLASEVATLCGFGGAFRSLQEVVQTVQQRLKSTRKSGCEERDIDATLCVRGKANYCDAKTGLPVLVKKVGQGKQLSCRIWPGTEAQALALCFLYHADTCLVVERSETDQFQMSVAFSQSRWEELVHGMRQVLVTAEPTFSCAIQPEAAKKFMQHFNKTPWASPPPSSTVPMSCESTQKDLAEFPDFTQWEPATSVD